MNSNLQEMWDVISPFYDDENNFSDDADMFLKMAGKLRGEVLELACGTGRILIPFAQAGYTITGLDFSEKMLDRGREKIVRLPKNVQKRISLVHADMTDFQLSKKFAFIFIGFNSLLTVIDFRKQEKVIRLITEHLKPGGRVGVSVINPDLGVFSEKVPYVKHAGTWIDSATGHTVDCFEFDYFDLANQFIYGTKLYDEIDDQSIVRRTRQVYEMRYFFSYELQLLLEKQGLKVLNIYGDYSMKPFTEKNPYIIFECRK